MGVNGKPTGVKDESNQFPTTLTALNQHYPGQTPRETVDAAIGQYLVRCDRWTSTASDGVFQSCYYDFSGDGITLLSVPYRREYPNSFDLSQVPTDNTGGQVWGPWAEQYQP